MRDAARRPRQRRRAGASSTQHVDDLGYALLLKRYTPNVTDATAGPDRAPPRPTRCRPWRRCSGASASWWGSASTSSPCSASMFWLSSRRQLERSRAAAVGLPLVAAAALDRRRARLVRRRDRPPALDDRRRAADLPVGVHASRPAASGSRWRGSSCSTRALAVVELYLMVRTIRLGPDQAPTKPALPARRPAE